MSLLQNQQAGTTFLPLFKTDIIIIVIHSYTSNIQPELDSFRLFFLYQMQPEKYQIVVKSWQCAKVV